MKNYLINKLILRAVLQRAQCRFAGLKFLRKKIIGGHFLAGQGEGKAARYLQIG
jgi:hypothetical protein